MEPANPDTRQIRSHWKIWTTAKSEVAAQRAYDRLVQRLGRTPANLSVERYWKTGVYLLYFDVELSAATWEAPVVAVIGLGQRIGGGWTLNGDIYSHPSGLSDRPSVVGVDWAEWFLPGGTS